MQQKSAAVIAEDVLHAELNQEPVATLPSIENLAQAANRHHKIHAFIKANGKLKQATLMFILMSGKRKNVYRNVITKVKNLFPPGPSVTWVVADFEAVMQTESFLYFQMFAIKAVYFTGSRPALRRKMGVLGILKSYKNHANII